MARANSGLRLKGTWEITKYKGTPIWCAERNEWQGEVLQHVKAHNVVTNTGRDNLFKLLFDLSGVAMVAGGVGDDATAPAETQAHLVNELILGTTRKTLTNVDGSPLSNTISNATLPSFRQMTVMWEYPSTDDLDGETFAEFGVFSTATLPGSGSGTSGVMFGRFLSPTPFTKDNGSTIQTRATYEW